MEMGKRGVARSSVLITEALAGNVVGSDPHKRTVTTTVLDGRGGVLGTAHYKVSGDGHRAMGIFDTGIQRPAGGRTGKGGHGG